LFNEHHAKIEAGRLYTAPWYRSILAPVEFYFDCVIYQINDI